MFPSSHFVIHLAQRAPNTGPRLKGGPKTYTISNDPSGQEGTRKSGSTSLVLRTCSALGKGRGNTVNPPVRRKLLQSPRLAALPTNFPAAVGAPSLTRGRSHDSPCSSLPCSPPSILAPLTVHCLKSLSRREKPPRRPHSVPLPSGATRAPHKGRGRLQGPGGAPGREPQAAGGRARAPPSRAPGGWPGAGSSRAHRSSAGACSSPAKKKKKKTKISASGAPC